MRPISKPLIEEAANRFIQLGVKDAVIIRSGELGAYVLRRKTGGKWVDAFWTEADASKIVDVTGERLGSYCMAPCTEMDSFGRCW